MADRPRLVIQHGRNVEAPGVTWCGLVYGYAQTPHWVWPKVLLRRCKRCEKRAQGYYRAQRAP
jgi:hypothetical protein